MFRILPALFLVVVIGVSAQPKYGHKDPYEVLETAAKKAAALTSARFVATTERKPFHGTQVETTRASITGLRDSTSPLGMRCRIEGDGQRAIYNGDTMWIGLGSEPLDLFDRREDAEGSARSQSMMTMTSRLLFNDGDPYTSIASDAIEIECEGLDTIDGVVCHAMTVKMPDVDDYTGRVRRYSFGADDYVLRRLISETQWEGLVERMTLTITDVQLDPAAPASLFTHDAAIGRDTRRASSSASTASGAPPTTSPW